MSAVLVTIEEGVLHLVLNRPERRNALSIAMYETLAAALRAGAADPLVRVVHITGAGGHFTSGNDLTDFMANPPTPEGSAVIDFLTALVQFPKPLVAEVSGVAVGVGVTMLLHCDLVFLSDNARLRMPFVSLGLVPEAASSLLLPQIMGHVAASELLMLGEEFDAATALRLQLCNGVVSPAELPARAARAIQRLADQPLASLMATKELMKGPNRAAVEAAMRAEGAIFFERLQSPEAMEAFQAFFEKRKPDFRQFN
jgi:enoyl-CoA hydratase/carnithine racemase